MVILGPKVMKNRRPFELKFAMVLFNILAITLSAYMFIKVSVFIGYSCSVMTFDAIHDYFYPSAAWEPQ